MNALGHFYQHFRTYRSQGYFEDKDRLNVVEISIGRGDCHLLLIGKTRFWSHSHSPFGKAIAKTDGLKKPCFLFILEAATTATTFTYLALYHQSRFTVVVNGGKSCCRPKPFFLILINPWKTKNSRNFFVKFFHSHSQWFVMKRLWYNLLQ